uniref:Uncharacterized protein n=1 Tax=Arundo donax TaxID=35708 RepID=A0A0A8YI72_ARUDO
MSYPNILIPINLTIKTTFYIVHCKTVYFSFLSFFARISLTFLSIINHSC